MSNQVVKIELKGKRFLELLQTVLKDQLPADATVDAAYNNPGNDTVGFLVASKDYPVVEGGDLVFYARALDLISVKDLKAVIEQGQAAITPASEPDKDQGQTPATDSGKAGK
jgi:hypothetical protein